MTPDKVEAALGVLNQATCLSSTSVREALSVLTEALAERERDAARYRWLRNDPPLELCVRARNAFGESAYTDGADLDTAIDAAMKDTGCELSDAEMDATTDYRGHDPDYDRKDTDHAR